jgi:hypothetical protein
VSRSGPHGYLGTTKFQKTGEFYQDVSRGVYGPNWLITYKFGEHESIPNGVWVPITNLQPQVALTWLTAATTIRVKAGGNAADTAAGAGARAIRVWGINSDATAEITEDIVLAGADASSSTTQSFWRVYRAAVISCGTYATPYNTGDITIENTAGTLDLLKIDATEAQTKHLLFSLPTGTSATLLGFETHIEGGKPADIRFLVRDSFTTVTAPVAPQRVIFDEHGITGESQNIPKAPLTPFNGPCDVWIEAEGGGAVTSVSGAFQLFCYPTP